ncbi:MAG TPA: glutathione S-transferase C-terminal domain-containing protein [Acetobacteraceae bacterium]|nr:glutathione S-transferase C-terminal domain-containing protein [Acetobacteraceae bacterium]
MLRIWGRANSSNVMKLLVLAEELGLPFERIDAGGAFGRTREPDYLARRHAPDGGLYPADLREAADCDRWMDWQLGALNRPATVLLFTYCRTPEAERDWPATHKARDEAERLWAMLEARLAGRPWIAGQRFTIADIALGIYVHRWFNLPHARGEMPALRAWYERLLARPAYAKHAAGPIT